MRKFADEAFIEVSSGSGGNGCVAFRREKYVPKGGPSGGDGGRGGNVVFEVRFNLRTLAHLRYKQSFKAENGRDGEGSQRFGKKGEDVLIPVPPGTVLKDPDNGRIIRDFGKEPGRFIFLAGGNGGWGNVHFKSSVNRAPRKALPGKAGEKRRLHVELQIMADIGLVGFPNAGKSSLLDRFTNARPQIAPYPFTTKIPNLGVLSRGDRDIVLADIPGIIQGASSGAGLGIRFLKHISRTSGLIFLIDLSEDSYLEAFDILYDELKTFSLREGVSPVKREGFNLLGKPRLIVGTKLDLEETAGRLAALRKKYPDETIFGISVFSGEGLAELAGAITRLADAISVDSAAAESGLTGTVALDALDETGESWFLDEEWEG
ncbi:MAG: GTPase ObgE [Treponema sp.]|jgi:GTP-binding protein|nr:GTPase ObgE [Treponema sp.]